MSEALAIDVTASCWNWIGSRNYDGYGIVSQASLGPWVGKRAHRYVWTLFRGAIPDGLQIDHLCRNRQCVNPLHLEVVTRKENILRGAGLCAVNARKTHCIRGHAFTPENTVLPKTGGRICRACRKVSNRAADLRRQARRRLAKIVADTTRVFA